MHKATILNKIKLLDIRNPWQISIVQELSNRRGVSAKCEPLFRDARKRLKMGNNQNSKKLFNQAISKLKTNRLIYDKSTSKGNRIHLLRQVWQLDNAIFSSISASTISKSKGRRDSIKWQTILKDVRKELSDHNIKLAYSITETLVFYFLLHRCGWQTGTSNILRPPIIKSKKCAQPIEDQKDLFTESL